MRQGANSAVRFTTYATLKQFVQGTMRPGQALPSAITFGIGGIAGLVTVYTTMPLEYVPYSVSCCPSSPQLFLASSRPVCNLWEPEKNIAILSIVLIGFSTKKGFYVFGLVRLLDLSVWWCVFEMLILSSYLRLIPFYS